jgi:hypothetical protein
MKFNPFITVVKFFSLWRFHTVFHNGIYFKEINDKIKYINYLEKLGNLLNKLESNNEQNFSQIQVVLNLRELLVCFILFTLGLFLSIIVFGLEIIVQGYKK